MLIVMLVLLMTTATAVFAVHATTFEIRAAGNTRQAMQTHYLAETGLEASLAQVDRMGPPAIITAMYASTPPATEDFGEPPMMSDKHGYRMLTDDFVDASGNHVIDNEAIGGSQQPYEPHVIIDLNDDYVYTGSVPGHRSDGYGRLRFMHATYSAHGRARLPAGEDVTSSGDTRPYHESAADARAEGLSGPFGR